jgi:uncharacterized protein YjdB
MKSSKHWLNLLLALLLPIAFAGCGGGGGGSSSVGTAGSSGTQKTLVAVQVTPANPSIAVGSSQQFTATGTYSDNSSADLTAQVTWTSSSTATATISNSAGSNGKATALAAGSSIITAALGAVNNSATLTVTGSPSATLVSIGVLPANPSIAVGSSQQFTATGSYSDGSSKDLTTQVTWSSLATGIATVSNSTGSNGKATAVAAGSATINAVSGGVTGQATLTVTGATAKVNVMTVTVNGALCSSGSYANKPCVSVTICTPGTSTCQTVSDILLDTGSYGLRIFKQALSVGLQQVTVSSRSVAECVQFGDGSSDWGPVQVADVGLGGEPVVQVPIQVIDSTFGTRSRACRNADTDPATAGFNGILGVGLFTQDCGSTCVSSAANGIYYSCSGTSCSGATVPLASQTQNPVALLPLDNNGVLLQLPSVALGGVPSVDGSLLLGIGTRSNNTPSGVKTYPADLNGYFTTTFQGSALTSSFIDSGSNGLYFTDSALPPCSGYYCPAATVSLSATNSGTNGTPSGVVTFNVGDYAVLSTSTNNVFSELGGTGSGGFDWGLPFFLGRNIFVGIEGFSSTLGTGPYWAY